MLYVLVAIILLSETLAMSFLKEYSLVRRVPYFLLGLVFYATVALCLIRSFHYEGMGMVNVIWSAFSVVFVESVAVYKFHERITHTQILGILFSLGGVMILRY